MSDSCEVTVFQTGMSRNIRNWEGPFQNNELFQQEFSSEKVATNLNGCICVLSSQEDCLSKQLPHFLEVNSESELQIYPKYAKTHDTVSPTHFERLH